MNKVFLIGRLTRDPEVRYTESGSLVGRFSIAVDRKFKKEGEPAADFFNCTTFGKQAEFTEKYLKKGIKMAVVGRIENDSYQNKDGQTVYSVKVMVDEMEFAEPKNANNTTPMEEPKNDGFKPVTQNNYMDIPAEWQEELPFE